MRAAVFALLSAGLLIAHADALRGMWRLWSNSPMYSYGYLVPFISLFLVWSRRHTLATLVPRPAPLWAGLTLAAWFVLLATGHLSGVLLAEQLAFILAIVSVVLLLLGTAYLRVTWAAIAYLLLMVPIWDGFTEPLHLRFQLLSASIAAWMLQAVGIPAFREGTFIDLAAMKLEVARACSGVNYLVAVIALGLPLAYLFLESTWRRIVLLASAVFIAAFSNSLRVALIGLLVHLDIGSPLHGPAHVLHGLFVAGIGHVALFVGLWALGGRERPDGPAAQPPRTKVPATSSPAMAWRSNLAAGALAVGFFGVAGLLVWGRPLPVSLAAPLEQLPTQLGRWTADPFTRVDSLEWWNSPDAQLRRRYQVDGHTVDVDVTYFEAQRQDKEVVTYRTSAAYRDGEQRQVALSRDESMPVTVIEHRTGDRSRLTVLWYELDGSVVATPSGAKLRTLWNSVRWRRANGAAISLTADLSGGTDRTALLQSLLDLVPIVHAGLASSLPRGARQAAQVHSDTSDRTASVRVPARQSLITREIEPA